MNHPMTLIKNYRTMNDAEFMAALPPSTLALMKEAQDIKFQQDQKIARINMSNSIISNLSKPGQIDGFAKELDLSEVQTKHLKKKLYYAVINGAALATDNRPVENRHTHGHSGGHRDKKPHGDHHAKKSNGDNRNEKHSGETRDKKRIGETRDTSSKTPCRDGSNCKKGAACWFSHESSAKDHNKQQQAKLNAFDGYDTPHVN
jgi:hypothetical protein